MCRAELPPGPEKLFEDAISRWLALHRRHATDDMEPWQCGDLGDADRREIDEVMGMLREAAEGGDADAQRNLGFSHEFGQGVALDESAAVKWYRKAAEQGDPESQYNLGNMYMAGRGAKKSALTARKWWRKAAEQGYALGQYNLGCMYRNGDGVVSRPEWDDFTCVGCHPESECASRSCGDGSAHPAGCSYSFAQLDNRTWRRSPFSPASFNDVDGDGGGSSETSNHCRHTLDRTP